MSLIPFILDLADELKEFNRFRTAVIPMDADDDTDFGMYPLHLWSKRDHSQHPSEQQMRRNRIITHMKMLSNAKSRHHPYGRQKVVDSSPVIVTPLDITAHLEGNGASSAQATTSKCTKQLINPKRGFQVSMNVREFAASDLSVKTVDNCIVVEGRHAEKEDGHGVISRHFIRKYILPSEYNADDVRSTLSSDGILTVKAPLPTPHRQASKPAAATQWTCKTPTEAEPQPQPQPELEVEPEAEAELEPVLKAKPAPDAGLDKEIETKNINETDTEPMPAEATVRAITLIGEQLGETETIAGKEAMKMDFDRQQTDEPQPNLESGATESAATTTGSLEESDAINNTESAPTVARDAKADANADVDMEIVHAAATELVNDEAVGDANANQINGTNIVQMLDSIDAVVDTIHGRLEKSEPQPKPKSELEPEPKPVADNGAGPEPVPVQMPKPVRVDELIEESASAASNGVAEQKSERQPINSAAGQQKHTNGSVTSETAETALLLAKSKAQCKNASATMGPALVAATADDKPN